MLTVAQHDTYEERITMLTSMLNGEGERPTSSSSSNGPVPMDHRPRPSIDAAASLPLAPPAAALPSRPTTGEEGMLGIGNAMLSDAASVKSHGSPSEDQQATIRPSRMPSRPSIDTKPPHGRTASQVSIRERQSPIEAPITIERFRDVQSPEHPTAAPAPSPASVRVESPDLRRTRHTHSASTSTNSSGEFIIPVTATEFGLDWPGEMEKDMSTANRPIQATGQRILAGHVKHDSNGALITILGPPSENSTPRPSQPRPIPAEAQEESFMRIHRSTGSSSSSASSSPKDTPLPPLPIEARAGPPPGPPPSVPPPPRPMMPAARQSRTASLARQSVPVLQTQNGSRLLISASTAQGTISQRRRTPTFEQVEEEEADQSTLKRNAAAAMQPKDAPAMTMTELGVRRPPSLALASAPPSMPTALARRAERGSETGSLPMRLRTLSQPGKRPGLPSFATGGYPELPSEARASTASIRKVSAPVFMHQVSPPSLPPTPPSHDGMPMTYADDSSFVSAETPTSAAFAKTTSSTTIHSTSSPPPVPSDMSPSSPISPVRRPFQLMRRLRASINQGAYVSAKLYVPKQVWAQAGVKLSAVETKIRMVELLISGLEGVERAGDAAHFGGNASGTGMKKELDAFDGLLDGIQSTLAKKLGFSDVKGKKNGPVRSLFPLL